MGLLKIKKQYNSLQHQEFRVKTEILKTGSDWNQGSNNQAVHFN